VLKNIVQPNSPQIIGACALHAEYLTHTHTHTLRICNIIAFPLQQWLHERASMLRYTHMYCLSRL